MRARLAPIKQGLNSDLQSQLLGREKEVEKLKQALDEVAERSISGGGSLESLRCGRERGQRAEGKMEDGVGAEPGGQGHALVALSPVVPCQPALPCCHTTCCSPHADSHEGAQSQLGGGCGAEAWPACAVQAQDLAGAHPVCRGSSSSTGVGAGPGCPLPTVSVPVCYGSWAIHCACTVHARFTVLAQFR